MRYTRLTGMLSLVAAMGLGTACFADIAIDVTPGVPPLTLSPTGQTTQGWEFVANRPITVTHLGLYDAPNSGGSEGDGFFLEHPIGLWRQGGSLLASVTLPSGTGADTELLDGFRYLDVPDVSLAQGERYIVGFYTGPYTWPAPADEMWVWLQYFTWSADPAIEYVSGLWGAGTGLALPSTPTTVANGLYRFGPNFQFTDTVVPVPGAALLGILGLSCAGWRLRRRTR